MEDLFLTKQLDETRTLCISPLPKKTYREAGAKGLGGEYGYFIYEIDASKPGAGLEIIGKTLSVEAALRMFEILCRSPEPSGPQHATVA